MKPMKPLLVLFALLVLTACAHAQVIIRPANHVGQPAHSQTYCAWAAAATVASHHGYPGRQILDNAIARQPYNGRAYLSTVCADVRRRGLLCSYQSPGTYDRAGLVRSLQRRRPVIVGIVTGPNSAHAIAIERYGPLRVWYFDPDRPGSSRWMPRPAFNRVWMGNAMLIRVRQR